MLLLLWSLWTSVGPGRSCPARILRCPEVSMEDRHLHSSTVSFLKVRAATRAHASSQRWNCMGGTCKMLPQLGKTGEQNVHKRSAQTVVALGVPPMMFPGLERPCSSKSLTHRATSTTALVMGQSCINASLQQRQGKQRALVASPAGLAALPAPPAPP